MRGLYFGSVRYSARLPIQNLLRHSVSGVGMFGSQSSSFAVGSLFGSAGRYCIDLLVSKTMKTFGL
jgi:hypothetical protein